MTEIDYGLCEECEHAERDYCEYYGGAKRWFVSGCNADKCDRREDETD